MDIDPTACVTMVLDRREMSPDLSAAEHNGPRARITTVPDCQASPQQHRYYEHLLSGYSGALTSQATRLMHRYRVHDPAFSADDAVQDAALKMLQAHNEGKIRAPDTDEDFARLFLHKLDQMVLQEQEREGRSKRGGPGASHDHPVRVVVHCGRSSTRFPRIRRRRRIGSSPRMRSIVCSEFWMPRTLACTRSPWGWRTGLPIRRSPPSSDTHYAPFTKRSGGSGRSSPAPARA